MEEHRKLFASPNNEYKIVYEAVMGAISPNRNGLIFIYGHGGIRKTYIYQIILAIVRAEEKIALVVASLGIIALLLPGRRTAHSRFLY